MKRFFSRDAENSRSNEIKDKSFADIVDNISEYFSSDPQVEKVLRYEDFDSAGDTYYARVCARYKILQRIFWIAFALFTVITVILNVRYITYDNFFYLMKDLNVAAQSSDMNYETLSYDAASDQSFTLYRGGLAVVSRSNVSAFTSTGRRTLKVNSSYSKPFAVASDKYLLVYDSGGNSFSIYNSFSKVFTEKLDHPVIDACFSESGRFAIITRSAEYESQIKVYSSNYKNIFNYHHKDRYAVDVSLDKKGERLAIMYLDTDDGVARTTVTFYDLVKYEKAEEVEYSEEFPISCSFFENGAFGAVTTSAVHRFDQKMVEDQTSENYSTKKVSAVFCDEKDSAVALNDGVLTDVNEILVFDKKGDIVYNDVVLSDAEQIGVCDGYVFIKNISGVMRIDVESSTEQQIECQEGKMLIYDSSTALVCAGSKAIYLKF